MRAVVQRVSSATVTIDQKITASITRGLLVLLGIGNADTPADVEWLASKIPHLRIFPDPEGKMNLSLLDLGHSRTSTATSATAAEASVLVVSQFTLLASTRKGNRPSYNDAARPGEAIPLYESFLTKLEQVVGRPISAGTFGAMMEVALVNDGPVTLILDSKLRE
jgi:D-tyrosyl-tRNA(Tyr) deacylase